MIEVWWRVKGTSQVHKERMSSQAAQDMQFFLIKDCDYHQFLGIWGTHEKAFPR